MTLYSVLLGQHGGAAAAEVDLYTVPASHIVVVTDVVAWSNGVGLMGVLDSSSGLYIVRWAAPASEQSWHWSGRQVVQAGSTVHFSLYTGQWHCRVSGYLLTI